MIVLLRFCFGKATLKSILHNFFISKRIVGSYRRYPNLVRPQIEIISDHYYLVRILFER